MGQDLGLPGKEEAEESAKPTKRDAIQAERELKRAKQKIAAFRNRATLRAGTDDLCATLLVSWRHEKERISKTWKSLSDPARRTLVAEVREKVVQRAKILHSVIAPRALSASAKAKAVRRLMEKTAFELFDTNLLYGDIGLILLIEDIFTERGGGHEPPFGLLHELDQTFPDPNKKKMSTFSLASMAGHEEEDPGHKETAETTVLRAWESSAGDEKKKSTDSGGVQGDSAQVPGGDALSLKIEGSVPLRPCTPPASPVEKLRRSSRSINSLQGYFNTTDQIRTARIHGGSKTIATLLHFMPDSALGPQARKQLTLELLMEMRHAFLTHFAVLILSELFDDEDKVMHKFEYGSDSDTDHAATDTDVEEEEEGDFN